MADRTGIEWADATWNPIRGCTRVSAGCQHCYAETMAGRFSNPGQPYHGLVERVRRPDGRREARWTGEVQLVESVLDAPLRWSKPRRIFVNSMSDLFHEKVSDEWLYRIFEIMMMGPHHTFLVLTKRPERMRSYLMDLFRYHAPFKHVWLGVSVEDQETAVERIPILLDTPAAVRFISAEPLLGPVRLTHLEVSRVYGTGFRDALTGVMRGHLNETPLPVMRSSATLDWVIVGGESGPGARPMDLEWAVDIVRDCRAAGVPVFVKQLGAAPYSDPKTFDWPEVPSPPLKFLSISDRKGAVMADWPEELRVRERPR